MSGGSAAKTSLYRLGTRFIESMPTLASVTPAVPPMMIINAGMLMNDAGLVPAIIELSSREPKATPMPMAVEAFIAPLHRPAATILQSCRSRMHKRPQPEGAGGRDPQRGLLADVVVDGGEPGGLTVGRRRPRAARPAAAGEGFAEHVGAVGADRRGDVLRALRDDHLRARGERDHRVGGRLDRDDHVGVQLKWLVRAPEPAQRDHGSHLSRSA